MILRISMAPKLPIFPPRYYSCIDRVSLTQLSGFYQPNGIDRLQYPNKGITIFWSVETI